MPLVITSLGAVAGLVDAIHSYGGLVFHDVVNARHGKKAAAAGVDGLIAVCNGAGGLAGSTNPFALVSEIRQFFDKTVMLAGSLSHGKDVATVEANIADDYQNMMINSSASDILYTPKISGVNASFMRQSVVDSGIDPTDLTPKSKVDFGDELELGNQNLSEKRHGKIFGLHFASLGDAKRGYKFKKETWYFFQNHLPVRKFFVFDRGEIKNNH